MRELALSLILALAACPEPPPAATCQADPDCASGKHCVQGACLEGACGDRPCRAGEACVDGTCRAADCLSVQCPAGQGCAKGKCYPADCAAQACGEGDVCPGQECTEPSCVGVACGQSEACAAQKCRATVCDGVTCAPGDVCEGGSCVSTRCVGVVCGAGTVCADGRCVPSACNGVACEAGQACLDGACVDAACVGRKCPSGQSCKAGACLACEAREQACGDGEDEDCDGKTDCADGDCEDQRCGDALVCFGGACVPEVGPDAGAADGGPRDAGGADAGAATDAGEPDAGVPGCTVAAQSYAAGDLDPANPCRSCQPLVDAEAFSPVADGVACEAAKVCAAGACQAGCWIGGQLRASGEANPADAYQACIPEVSTTAWTDSAPRPDSYFAKISANAYSCGLTHLAGTSVCATAFGADWTWPDVWLGLHGPAYEAAKREAPSVAREYFVYGTDAVPGYYGATVVSAAGGAGRGSAYACPATRKLLCAVPAHSPFQVTGPAWHAGSAIAFDSDTGRHAVFYVTDGAALARQLRMQLLTKEGALVGGPRVLASGFGDLNGGTNEAPRVHADFEPADKRFRLFYSKGREASGRYALYALTLAQDGAVDLPERVVESGTYDLNDAFDVAVDRANRRYLLAYYYTDLTTYAVRARYVGPDDAVGASFDLERDDYNVSTLAATFTGLHGRFIVVYPAKTASTGATVKVVASGATTAVASGTLSVATGTARLRLSADPAGSTALLVWAANGNVVGHLVNDAATGAGGGLLQVNAFAGEASSVRGLVAAWNPVAGHHLVAYDGYLQAVTAANAKAISTVEEAIAGGYVASGVVQAIAFGQQGTAAVLHRPDAAGAGILFTLRTDAFDVY